MIVERIMKGENTLDDVDDHHPLLPVIQDTVSIGAQKRIADHLGQSDKGVATLRRVWARELRALREGRP